ncbi:MAG: dodecin domain-containing protein [Deltaproteobacteria bacterium]|nr:dodecin domain-containing protein [Deltaproteobacteria bacterium]MBI3294544.1 dodecin domain-containing protein [Deltaproteobacteria bacterium]
MKKKKIEKAVPKKKAEVHEEDLIDDGVGNAAPGEKSSQGGSVYKVIEVIGSSSKSWEHAAQVAVERASETLEDLRVAEVVDQDLKIEKGTISAYRTKLRLSFKFRQ